MSEAPDNNVVPMEQVQSKGMVRVTAILKKVIEPVIVKPYRGKTFAPTTVSVNAASPTLIAAANPRRVKIKVFNTDNGAQVYVGDENVAVNAGECIRARDPWEEDRTTAAIYAITSVGTFNVVVTEI